MRYRWCVPVGLFLGVLGFAPPSGALSTTLQNPAFGTANDTDGNGTFDSLTTTGTGFIGTRRFDGLVIDRGLLEFDLSGIPSSATIESVSFAFRIVLTGSGSQGVDVVGYSGDGAVAIGDATVAGTLLGNYDAGPLGLGFHSLDLGTAFLQALVGTGASLGLRLQADADGVNTAIGSPEFGDEEPKVVVTFSLPEPGAAISLLAGAIWIWSNAGPSRRR
jgi:hypothetical protein